MNSNIDNQIVKGPESSYWVFIIILISIGLFFLCLKIQSPITYGFSPLFDGNDYLKIYHYFDGNLNQFNVSFPYHSRVLVPFLASLMPFQDPVNNFHAVNLLFLILSVGMIYILWSEYKLALNIKLLGFILLLFHWVGIIRHNIFDPITVDVPIYFFEALILWLIIKKKYLWLIIVGPLSVLVKELFLALLIVIWIYFLITSRKISNKNALIYLSIALVVTFFTKIMVNEYFPPLQSGRGSIITILFHIKETLYAPFRIIRWITGVFVAYGIYLMIGLIHFFRKPSFKDEEVLLGFISLFYLALSFLGGGDFTRLVFLGFPFIITWILIQFKEIPVVYYVVAIFANIPLMKLHKSIPDPASVGWQKFYNWFPEFAPPLLDILWLSYGVGIFVLIKLISRKFTKEI